MASLVALAGPANPPVRMTGQVPDTSRLRVVEPRKNIVTRVKYAG